MRILVCGSRHFNDIDLLRTELDKINGTEYMKLGSNIKTVISGCAKGADTLGLLWAAANKIDTEEYPADWNKHGKAAGPIRNKQMLDEGKPDLVIAFLAKDSRGTRNMVDQATKSGVPVKVINI